MTYVESNYQFIICNCMGLLRSPIILVDLGMLCGMLCGQDERKVVQLLEWDRQFHQGRILLSFGSHYLGIIISI